jgi:hypothetical protein
MKTVFFIIFLAISLNVMAQNQYTTEWQKVDSLSGIGQAQTALDRVISIYDQSKTANQADQFVKASLYRMKLESDFEEEYFEKSIARTQSDLQTAQTEVKHILHSIIAELYWRYYQNNRWQFLNRSETSGFVSDDIKTWDSKKLVSACVENYALSLTDKELLKRTTLTSFTEILVKQKDSDKFRPTLFDLLAYRAIDFYSSSEAGLTKPATTFLMDKTEYFASSAEFADLNLTSPDTLSFEYQVIKLYQEVIAFHLSDKAPAALIDAETGRLWFVHEKSVLPEKDSLYLAALNSLESLYKNHPSSTEVAFKIASQLNGGETIAVPFLDEEEAIQPVSETHKWDKKKAIVICEAAISRFPESTGSKNCRSLIESIKQPSLAITTEYASIPEKPSLALVSYKNISKVFFRLIKINPETDRDLKEKEQSVRLEKYLGLKAEKSWEQVLPDDGDFRSHSAEIRIPALPQGYYVLLSSNDATFPARSAIIIANSFWMSTISYLSRNDKEGNNEIVVLHCESGQPLPGVKVKSFYREYNSMARKYESKAGDVFLTDKSGMVVIPPKSGNRNYNQFYLVFSMKKDQLITESFFSGYSYRNDEPRTIVQTRFFTDRAIYRPGQTIFFKGIVLERKGEDVKIKPRFKTEVALYDANGQAISKQTLTTNDFGSFSGNFIAPLGVLTGQMTIRCESGSVSVQVEEFKRPKFEVTFEPVKGSYKLGETISVKGKTTAYAGSTVPDAKVRYRVVRSARFPYWWGWRGMPRSAETEIANGETVTGDDGSFAVTFKAIPDLSLNRKTDPVFNYKVYADGADLNGESHSSETGISVGYKALLIKTDLADDVNFEKGVQFTLTITNLNGEKEATSGKLTISRLRSPDHVLYPRKWTRPDRFSMTKSDFEKDFPGEVYNNEDDVTTWPKEANSFSEDSTVYKANFQTPADSVFWVGPAIEEGTYVVEIKTTDAFGEEVIYKKYFNAFQPKSTGSDAVSPSFFTLLNPTAEPGEEVKFVIGTPVKKAFIFYEIIHKDKIVSREILNLSKEQKLISIPVKEEYRGNFAINLFFVKNNRTFQVSGQIRVPYTDKKLDISFATFRNKLLPGQEEEWQITLRDSKGEKAVAEMLAGMYDASLDAFVPHSWSFDVFYYYYGTRSWNGKQCFGIAGSEQYTYPTISYEFSNREYDQLNWFGFNFGFSGGRMRYMLKGAKADGNMDMMARGEAMPVAAMAESDKEDVSLDLTGKVNGIQVANQNVAPDEKQKPSQSILIRKDFNETAFFFPQIATNENGEIIIKFKAPEALTRWKMMGLAYTRDLKYGQVEKTLVTQKDLMFSSRRR